MNSSHNASVRAAIAWAEPLAILGETMIRAAQEAVPPKRKPRRGATLRPGPLTPLWKALVELVNRG